MKKIIVTVREFKTGIPTRTNVDSRLYDGDTKEPIVLKEKDPQGYDYDYHLGQISSDLLWAIQDISDQDRTAKQELDKRYPTGYEFVFYYLPVDFVNKEIKTWWKELSDDHKKKLIIARAEVAFGPLEEKDIKRITNNKVRKLLKYEVEHLWQVNQMVHTALDKITPVDLNNIIF